MTEPFFIACDAGASVVTFILGGVTLTDRESVMDQSQATGNGLDDLWKQGAILNDGFTLTGNAVLTWTGAAPTQSRLAFQIKVGKLGIVSTEESSWGRIKLESGSS